MHELREIIEPLLEWFDQNKRTLPWRSDPTFYHVWISEIMLQQTRVEAVKEYYHRFMDELPTVMDLANVDDDQLMKLWQGLGYYNRARNLKKSAILIKENYQGNFPPSYEELLKLPGIGSYTAGAIASIAFQIKVPAVDGNVLRVITRILGSDANISKPSTKKWLEKELEGILPDRVGDFNQALMELGALICVPNGSPHCRECPLQNLCVANRLNLTSLLPIKDLKKTRKKEEKTILLFYSHHKVALLKRKETGLLAGLFEFPNIEGKLEKKELLKYLKKQHIDAVRIEELSSAKHVFSHIEWHMIGYKIILDEIFESEDYIWSTIEELETKYAIPTAFLTYVQLVKEELKR